MNAYGECEKLDRLLRRHRTKVFDPKNGDCHVRAIRRLKGTATAKRVALERAYMAVARLHYPL